MQIVFARHVAVLMGLLGSLHAPALSQTTPSDPSSTNSPPLTRLPLRELASVEVTSVSRTEERLLNAPAAIYVLSNEDVRRSGALNIAEALRMVPGLNVAQINANKWAISSRGFNNRFANKLLVLMDGRASYTPVFSGVYWDTLDTLMEDLEHIEVIRGPGGALWGANAVNGVISINTKPAYETQGALLNARYGSEVHGGGGFRYGGEIAENLHYRVYAKALNHSDFRELGGGEAADEWWQQREGFRLDWRPGDQNLITFQGDYFYGEAGDRLLVATPTAPYRQQAFERLKASGGNVLARWTHTISEASDFKLQAYYDRNDRSGVTLDAQVETYDLDFQHRVELGGRNELVWGAGYRLVWDEMIGSPSVVYTPQSVQDHLWSAFVQDRLAVIEDKLWLTLGAKVEHNDYTGWELQPSVRLTLKPTERQTLWAASSRAVRTPSRYERDSVSFTPIPTLASGTAVSRARLPVESEELLAHEIGYRIEADHGLFLDLALFYNDYDSLRSSERGAISAGPPLMIPLFYENEMEGEAYGFEFAPSWQVKDYWRLSAGYSLLKMDLRVNPGSTDTSSEATEGDSPQQQFHLRSFLDLPHNVQLDTGVYYVDELPNQRLDIAGTQRVQDYTRLDVRLGWMPIPNLDLSLVFQNLLDARHAEFGSTSPLVTPTEIERSLYAKVTWRF